MEPDAGRGDPTATGEPQAAFDAHEGLELTTTLDEPAALTYGPSATGPADQPAPGHAGTDPLERICTYLRSVDGTWRSARPDADHRCTSQQPPASLPMLAQERFCLTDNHVRCEWYKMAETARHRALEQDGIPGERIRVARFKPVVRSVPLALDSPGVAERPAGVTGALALPWRVLVVAVVVVALSVIGLVIFAGGSSGPSPTPPLTAASEEPASAGPGATASPTSEPTPTPTDLVSGSTPTPAPTPLLVYYEVQDNERMAKIADKFGIRKGQIIKVNDLGDPPRVEPGQVIVLPLPPGSTPPPGTQPVIEVP